MPPKPRKPSAKKNVPGQFDDIEDFDDIGGAGGAAPSGPSKAPPRLARPRSAKRTSAPSQTSVPVQPQPKPQTPAPSSKPAKRSRFIDEIDPDLIAASLKPSVTPAKEKRKSRNTPADEASRLRPPSVASFRDLTSTPTTAPQLQFQKPLLPSSSNGRKAARLPRYQNTPESSFSAGRTPASRHVPQPSPAAPTPTPAPRPRQEPQKQPPLSQGKLAKKPRFQNELDPDLLALVTVGRKKRASVDLYTPLKTIPAASVIAGDSDSPPISARRRQKPIPEADSLTSSQGLKGSNLESEASPSTAADKPTAKLYIGKSRVSSVSANTPTPRPRQTRAAVIPARLLSLSKRPRGRSSSPPDFVPDTPPPKRQQQGDQRQSGVTTFIPETPGASISPGTITLAPRRLVDDIEDSSPVQWSKSSQKRQILEIDSSPTRQVNTLRKRQKFQDGVDIIEDGPDSQANPARTRRTPYTVKPKRVHDASSSGDEVAEHIDAMHRKAKLTAQQSSTEPTPSSQGPRTETPRRRRLMDPKAMHLYLQTSKPVPPQFEPKPGMINVLTYGKSLVIPRDPTPPPVSSPTRRAYVERGLAETAMFWKHDAQEHHTRKKFTEESQKLTCHILVQEFLRDGKMCIVKGQGENESGKEGLVKAVVTDRVAVSITKGLAVWYERPWFPVRLFGEEEPYRFLIGRVEVKDPRVEKAKNKESEQSEKPGRPGKRGTVKKVKAKGAENPENPEKTKKTKRTKRTKEPEKPGVKKTKIKESGVGDPKTQRTREQGRPGILG